MSSRHGHNVAKNVAILMLFWPTCFSQKAGPAPPNNIAIHGAFITLYGYVSKGPKLERHSCKSMLQCGHLCLENAKSVSFNYQVSSVRNGLCELSEEGIASEQERDKRLKAMLGFVFVQGVRKDMVS